MVKKRVMAIWMITLSGVLLILLFMLYFINAKMTGKVSATGLISLYVESGNKSVYIMSPENKSYNFNIGDIYWINLNVSSDFAPTSWKYDLYDLRHSKFVYSGIEFTPNISISALRWNNKLIVYAKDEQENWYSNNVVFYVAVPNTAPILDIEDTVYTCEGRRLSYLFNASDVDEDSLTFDIAPKNPFYVVSAGSYNLTLKQARIFSGLLTKSTLAGSRGYKVFPETVYVFDSNYSDFANINVVLIEINNAPVVEPVGAITLWTRGENSALNKTVVVSDVEDGNTLSGNFNFSAVFSGKTLFSMNNSGIINFKASEEYVGVHNVSLCVADRGIPIKYDLIQEKCNQTGESLVSCQNFSITVTNQNRAPVILNYSPSSLVLNGNGNDIFNFNITSYDADGTLPDVLWNVDGELKESDYNSLNNNFSYFFGCGVTGNHFISAFVSDGLENETVTWNISLSYVACLDKPSSGGGGSGGSMKICYEEWACDDWKVCQNAKESFENKIISPEDYSWILIECLMNNYDERYCGYQIKDCFNLNNCSNAKKLVKKPSQKRVCYYTKDPSCSDKITNCHHGACELFADCGGPCSPCPSCSDKIKNQGEEGVDCGGPCPETCVRKTVSPATIPDIVLGLISLVLAGVVIFKMIVLLKKRRELKSNRKK